MPRQLVRHAARQPRFLRARIEGAGAPARRRTWGFPDPFDQINQGVNGHATRAPPGYHTPEQVSNPEPLDSLPCVLTTTLLGGLAHKKPQHPGGRRHQRARARARKTHACTDRPPGHTRAGRGHVRWDAMVRRGGAAGRHDPHTHTALVAGPARRAGPARPRGACRLRPADAGHLTPRRCPLSLSNRCRRARAYCELRPDQRPPLCATTGTSYDPKGRRGRGAGTLQPVASRHLPKEKTRPSDSVTNCAGARRGDCLVGDWGGLARVAVLQTKFWLGVKHRANTTALRSAHLVFHV